MSNISLTCKISLSKKLRALMGGSGTIVLTTSDLVDGKGMARLSISSESNITPILDTTETSIMLTPIEVTDEMPVTRSVASIFSSIPDKGGEENLIRKIAAVNPPERQEVSHAIISEENIKTPNAFSELDNKDCKKYIMDMTGLLDAINAAKHKVSDINLDGITNPREIAIRMEEREKSEAIDVPAYIVNDKVAMISVNDLGISLALNIPFDLSNISARRIAASKDFRGLLTAGYIKFISPKERLQFVNKVLDMEEDSGLDVYDRIGKENVEDIPSRSFIDVGEITEADLGSPTEEEGIINLTQIPVKKASFSNESIKTTHGSVPSNPSRTSNPDPSKPKIKPIQRKD